MDTTNEKQVDRLGEILEKNVDAEKGYRKAAENADSTRLRSYFERKARERKEFNDKLKSAMTLNYGAIEENGSVTGGFHRAWMDVKALFSADDDESMLEEAVRGDKAAVEEYEEILEDNSLPNDIALLLRDQKTKVRTDLNKATSMEDLQ